MSRRDRAVMIEPDGADGEVIYLDYHATTPCDPRVTEVVANCLRRTYGNPSSPHQAGKAAKRVVDDAREVIADQIGALPGEIVFTSGATESNNLAIRGLAEGTGEIDPTRRKILTSAIEHKSVLKSAKAAAAGRFVHELVPVRPDGRVDLGALSKLLDEKPLLVSVQAANNEIGTIQPIQRIANLTHRKGSYFHCDAAQALGRMRIDVEEWGVDLLSLSAHKAYGPKGVGALYIRGGPANLPLKATTQGGGQEHGLRPGTLNVPAIAGFAEACRIIDEVLDDEVSNLARLRDQFEYQLVQNVAVAEVVGRREHRLPSTTNVRFPGVEADAVLARIPDVAVSTGSACEAGAPEPSHVLRALGLGQDSAYECVRVAVGRFTSEEDVELAVERIVTAVRQIQNLAPVYEG